MKDYYKILEIERTALPDEIKRGYRNLVKKWHPDVCKLPNSHEKFIEITEAYEILINPIQRKEYDELWNYYDQAQQAYYRTNNASGNTYNHSNTESQYTNREQESHYKEREQSFHTNQTEARRRAQTYYSMTLDDLLSKVLGIVIDSSVRVAKYTILGQEDIKLTFTERLRIGFQVLLFILMVALTFTGILAPIGAPLGILLFKSMMKKGKFIGLGKMIMSTLMLVGLLLLGILIINFVGFTNDNSYTYDDSSTEVDDTFNNWENSININKNDDKEYSYNNSISKQNYVKPTKVSEEILAEIVDAYIAVGRYEYGYEYSYTEIGEVFQTDEATYQEYNIIQKDTLSNRKDEILSMFLDIESGEWFLKDEYILYPLDTIIFYRSQISSKNVKWCNIVEQNNKKTIIYQTVDKDEHYVYDIDISANEIDERNIYNEPKNIDFDKALSVLQEYIEPYEDAVYGEYSFNGIAYIDKIPYYEIFNNPYPSYGSSSIGQYYYVTMDLDAVYDMYNCTDKILGEKITKVDKQPYEEYLKAIQADRELEEYYNSREPIEGDSPYKWQEFNEPFPVYEHQQYLIDEIQAMEIAELVWMIKSPNYLGTKTIDGTLFYEFEYDTRRWSQYLLIDAETGIPYGDDGPYGIAGIYVRIDGSNISNESFYLGDRE